MKGGDERMTAHERGAGGTGALGLPSLNWPQRLPSWVPCIGDFADPYAPERGRPSPAGVVRRLAGRLQGRLLGGTSVSLGPTRARYALAMAMWCLAGVALIGADHRFVAAVQEALHRAPRVPAVEGQVLTVPETGEYILYADGPAGAVTPEVVGPRPWLTPERKGPGRPTVILADGPVIAVRDAAGRLRQLRPAAYSERIEAGRYGLRIADGQRRGTDVVLAPPARSVIGTAAVGGWVAASLAGAAALSALATRAGRRGGRRFGPGGGVSVRPALTVVLPGLVGLVAVIAGMVVTSAGFGSYSLVEHFPVPPLYVVSGSPVRALAVAVLLMACLPWQAFRLARYLRSAGRGVASTLACSAAVFMVPAVVLLCHFTLTAPLARWAA